MYENLQAALAKEEKGSKKMIDAENNITSDVCVGWERETNDKKNKEVQTSLRTKKEKGEGSCCKEENEAEPFADGQNFVYFGVRSRETIQVFSNL